jgi:5-methylcytosine-specific restriction endonuclease McrA
MAWKVEDDAAWIAEGDGSFRHYAGTRLLWKGSRWNAIGANGTSYPSRGSAFSALKLTGRYGNICDLGRAYGTVSHPTSPIGNDGLLFAFVSRDGSPFTPLVVSSLKRRFHGHARCVKCKEPMSEFRVGPIRQFDGAVSETETYLVCSCGFPVWHMETDVYFGAQYSMDQCARAWKRKQDMKAAGGKHTLQEIDAILKLQGGRCIYCHTLFTDTKRPTRDHLVPLSYGGTAWALNLVLACHSCNSRRGEIPFRTFCRLLSPRQNERILQHLYRRIRAIDFKNPNGGYEEFEIALRMHAPKDFRYKMILGMMARYRENVSKNKLLPLGAVGILKEIGRRQRAELRRLKGSTVG